MAVPAANPTNALGAGEVTDRYRNARGGQLERPPEERNLPQYWLDFLDQMRWERAQKTKARE